MKKFLTGGYVKVLTRILCIAIPPVGGIINLIVNSAMSLGCKYFWIGITILISLILITVFFVISTKQLTCKRKIVVVTLLFTGFLVTYSIYPYRTYIKFKRYYSEYKDVEFEQGKFNVAISRYNGESCLFHWMNRTEDETLRRLKTRLEQVLPIRHQGKIKLLEKEIKKKELENYFSNEGRYCSLLIRRIDKAVSPDNFRVNVSLNLGNELGDIKIGLMKKICKNLKTASASERQLKQVVFENYTLYTRTMLWKIMKGIPGHKTREEYECDFRYKEDLQWLVNFAVATFKLREGLYGSDTGTGSALIDDAYHNIMTTFRKLNRLIDDYPSEQVNFCRFKTFILNIFNDCFIIKKIDQIWPDPNIYYEYTTILRDSIGLHGLNRDQQKSTNALRLLFLLYTTKPSDIYGGIEITNLNLIKKDRVEIHHRKNVFGRNDFDRSDLSNIVCTWITAKTIVDLQKESEIIRPVEQKSKGYRIIFEKALKDFRVAMALDPNNFIAKLNSGECYLRIHRNDNAKEQYYQAKSLVEKDKLLHDLFKKYILANIYNKLGDVEYEQINSSTTDEILCKCIDFYRYAIELYPLVGFAVCKRLCIATCRLYEQNPTIDRRTTVEGLLQKVINECISRGDVEHRERIIGLQKSFINCSVE